MSEWKPIETAPKDGKTDFLVFGYWTPSFRSPQPRMAVATRRSDETFFVALNAEATHWMPLPEPPKAPDAYLGDGTPVYRHDPA